MHGSSHGCTVSRRDCFFYIPKVLLPRGLACYYDMGLHTRACRNHVIQYSYTYVFRVVPFPKAERPAPLVSPMPGRNRTDDSRTSFPLPLATLIFSNSSDGIRRPGAPGMDEPLRKEIKCNHKVSYTGYRTHVGPKRGLYQVGGSVHRKRELKIHECGGAVRGRPGYRRSEGRRSEEKKR